MLINKEFLIKRTLATQISNMISNHLLKIGADLDEINEYILDELIDVDGICGVFKYTILGDFLNALTLNFYKPKSGYCIFEFSNDEGESQILRFYVTKP